MPYGWSLRGSTGRFRQQYKFFFGEKIPYNELRPQPIDEEDREYFRPMIDPNFQCAPLGDIGDYQQQLGGGAMVYVA